MRLRTGLNWLNAHMFRKMKLAPSPICNSSLEDQTAKHTLQRCPAHFCRQQEQLCGQRLSSYTPNSTAARRNWRRQLHSSYRMDSQHSSDREEEAANSALNRQNRSELMLWSCSSLACSCTLCSLATSNCCLMSARDCVISRSMRFL